MRFIFIILFATSCSQKIEMEVVSGYVEIDTVLQKSLERTKAMTTVLPKIDTIIIKEEHRIEDNLNNLKYELNEIKIGQNKTKVVYIHDTIVIKEKTNFWGKKRITTDSMQSIDSTEYQ